MKHLWIFIILCASSAYGQNSYGADFLNLHCTAPDANAPPNFGDAPRPGLVPASAATGNAILYCDASTSTLKVSFSGGAYAGIGGFAGSGTNPFVATSTLALPAGTAGAPSLIVATGTAGVNLTVAGNNVQLISGGAVELQANASFVTVTPPLCDAATGNNCFTFASGKITVTGSGAASLGFGQGKGQHFINQAATSDMAGVCSGTTTTCSVTFTTAYTSTPSCVLTPTTAGVTSFIITTQANTGFTVTYAPSASTNFNYVCIGNPN